MLHREIETGSLWWCDCARGEWRGSYCARVDLDHSNKWVCAVIPMQALHYASHLARRGRVDNGITTLASNHDFMSQSGSGTGLLHPRSAGCKHTPERAHRGCHRSRNKGLSRY